MKTFLFKEFPTYNKTPHLSSFIINIKNEVNRVTASDSKDTFLKEKKKKGEGRRPFIFSSV